jgi:MFS family permease
MAQLLGALYARIPDIKEQLDISNSALGIALLCLPLGLLFGLGFSGKQSAKRGSAPVTYYSTYALAIALLIVGPVINYYTFCLTFVLFGACLATQDVAMNSHAIVLEHEADKRYMSTFHATFSMGALAGGLLGGFFAQQKTTIMWQSAFIAMLIFLANFFVRNMFLSADLISMQLRVKRKSNAQRFSLLLAY